MGPQEALGTVASKGPRQVLAGPAVLAGLRLALINIQLAVVAGVTWLTQAQEGRDTILALATIQAGLGLALVDLVTFRGVAPDTWHTADTGMVVLAEDVAQLTLVFGQRAHLGGVERSLGMLHLTGDATVDLDLTVPAGVAWGTVTLVLADVVETGASILAGPRSTGVWLTDLAVLAGEAVGAGAVVLAIRLPAGAPVAAGPRAAEPRLGFLAVHAKEALRALADVRVVMNLAGPSIQAGL